MTNTYDLGDIPFTTAESNFKKVLKVGDAYDSKKDLIDFAATDFADLRTSMLKYMKAVYPLEFENFNESDFGVMFTELVAYMGAVMSMKADMLANENFLSTAKSRANVKKLLELVGIKMLGPTSAGANAQYVLASPTSDTTITISAANRVITVTSPEDGAQLTFVLYKVANGKIVDLNQDSSILLSEDESAEGAGVAKTWTNLALIEGSLVTQTGLFDATDELKKIHLNESPVVENSCQVFLETGSSDSSGAFRGIDNLFQASSISDKVFEVVYDEAFNATLNFGDGTLGVSPPNDGSYTVNYRVGGGTRGNVLNSVIAGSIVSTAGAGTLQSTSVATGGQDAESVDHIKRYGPLQFKTQNRLVTLEDYKAFANRYSSPTGGRVIATAATRKAYSSANIIDVYVLQKATSTQLQRATYELKSQLLTEMQNIKMLTDEVIIVDGLIRTLDLAITANVDAVLEQQEGLIKGLITNIVTKHFSVDNSDFAKPFILQDLNKKIYELDQVRYSTIDNLDNNIMADLNEVIQLNNLTVSIAYI